MTYFRSTPVSMLTLTEQRRQLLRDWLRTDRECNLLSQNSLLMMLKGKHFRKGSTSTKKLKNILQFTQDRENGNHVQRHMNTLQEKGIHHLLQSSLFKEHGIPLEQLNKVFCSQWLTDNHVVFGTKCNQLVVLDVVTKKMVYIPNLQSSENSLPPENPCGIHAVATNPSLTLLASGGQNPKDVAVYSLPTMDPVCVGEGAHKDWIFDIKWLDDEFFVSGARDTTIALWRVQEKNVPSSSENFYPYYTTLHPLVSKPCQSAEKVRAMIFNQQYQVLAALTLNAYLHLWDVQSFEQKSSHKLPFCEENVCLTQQCDYKVYAVGSRSHTTLLDARTLKPVQKITSKYHGYCIRSLSFLGDMLNIGTGSGTLLFYDIRAGRYLEQYRGRSSVVLKATRGWVYPVETFREAFPSMECSPAIYTHCFDPSGTRLFAAGGPLPANLQGNYAALWQ